MPKVTKQQVVSALHREDYDKAAKLGPAALRHLKSIVEGDDWQLAAKAAHLAGQINVDASVPIIETVARSRKAVLHVAAAAAAGSLSPQRAERLLAKLLNSKDAGVRKWAVKSTEKANTPKLCSKLKCLQTDDNDDHIRALAGETLRKISRTDSDG